MTAALLFALASHASLPDAHYLRRAADSAGVPALVVLAVAWEETRRDVRPSVRGDSRRSIGRFQIQLATAHGLCPGVNILTYRGNVLCFLTMLKRDIAEVGVERAVARHNGRAEGPAARAYAQRVLATVGRWALENVEP